jgi:hypothetical protein
MLASNGNNTLAKTIQSSGSYGKVISIKNGPTIDLPMHQP